MLLTQFIRQFRLSGHLALNPDYALDHELHELTQIKIIKYIRSDQDKNLSREYIRDFVGMDWFHSRDS